MKVYRMMKRNVLLILYLFLNFVAWAIELEPVIEIAEPNGIVEFTRNTRGQAVVDSQGQVHLVYTLKNTNAASQMVHVFYRRLNGINVSEAELVDSGTVGGGREASLAIDAQDRLHAVWHDHRHGSASGNYVDNIEIYYARRTATETFLNTNHRLTQTQASHKGDNGYVPKIMADPVGRLWIAWYDFHPTGSNSVICLAGSDSQGLFPTITDIAPYQVTQPPTEGVNFADWLPSMALDAGGAFNLIWGRREGYTGVMDLYTSTVRPDGTVSPASVISETGGTFLDPPRLAYNAKGDKALVYPVSQTTRDTRLAYHAWPAGQSWKSPVFVELGGFHYTQPDVAVDRQGNAYIAWEDDREGLFWSIYLAKVDPNGHVLEPPKRISGDEEEAKTPALAIDPKTDRLHVFWLRMDPERNSGSIVYRREASTSVQDWNGHEGYD